MSISKKSSQGDAAAQRRTSTLNLQGPTQAVPRAALAQPVHELFLGQLLRRLLRGVSRAKAEM